jgi:hypothetical protein
MMDPSHRETLESKGWTSSIKDGGIAGIRDPKHVKCLHTMYAFYLAKRNEEEQARQRGEAVTPLPFPVGDWIHELLTSPTD